MSQINQNSFSNLSLKKSTSEYWDTIISMEKDVSYIPDGLQLFDDYLISYIDTNNESCLSGTTSLYSMYEYKWPDAVNSGLTLSNIGYTGVDDGLILFDKDNITQEELYDIFTGSTLNRVTGDTRLNLTAVSGNTNQFIYPISIVTESLEKSVRFDGGFYQGFYYSNDNYSILPTIVNTELCFDFILKPDFITEVNPLTLNYKYPNNKGMFFYLGARSENKFWYLYDKNDTEKYDIKLDLVSGDTIIYDYSASGLTTNDGFDVSLQNLYQIETDNKYLLFNRTINGYTTQNFDNNKTFYLTGQTKDSSNYYLYSNRTATGYTSHNLHDLDVDNIKYNVAKDVIKNTLGFRIKDDGSIGYRTIIESCDENLDYIIQEEYSPSGVTVDGEQTSISVRMVMNTCYSEYGDSNRTYKLMFYVDGDLVLISKSLPELLFRKLDDVEEKQETVPFNLSLGGGSQGLSDMIGFNTGYTTQYLLPIEKYFGGSFIGEISKFRFHNGKMDYSKIKNNYNFEFNFNLNNNTDYIEPTINFLVSGITLTYPETDLHREKGNTGSLLNGSIFPNKPKNTPYFPLLTGYKLYYYLDSNPQTEINGLFPIPTTGGIIPQYTHNDPTLATVGAYNLKYVIEVFDTYKTVVGTKVIKEIIFDDMIFYGTSTGSTDVRTLTGKTFITNTTELYINTGNVDKTFVIALPYPREIDMVVDENAMFADITRSYVKTITQIADAGGNLVDYNIYRMSNAIPYSRNHKHKITLLP